MFQVWLEQADEHADPHGEGHPAKHAAEHCGIIYAPDAVACSMSMLLDMGAMLRFRKLEWVCCLNQRWMQYYKCAL